MLTIDEVKKQVEALGETDTFGTKKEIQHLPQILMEDEMIKALTSGIMNGNTWLVTVTNKRVIFLDKGMFFGLQQQETPLERINSIEHKIGFIFGEISIWDGASKMTVENVMKSTVKKFVDAVNRELEIIRNKKSGNFVGVDLAGQIQKLAGLKDQGILTEEEFQQQKKKLLAA